LSTFNFNHKEPKMEGMELSIVIVSYNTKLLLQRCLESLGGEKKSNEREIIVVDNASTDGSQQMLEEKFPLVKLIKNAENVGFAKAVNKGVSLSEGGSILLLNSDTEAKENTLVVLLEFKKKVRPAIIGLKMLNPDGSVQSSVFRLPTIKKAFAEYWLGEKGSFSKYQPEGERNQEVEAVSGGAMLISREVIDKIGLLDERYFMYFEDLDYCRRARKAGFKIYYLPSAKVVHEHGASGKLMASQETQWRRLIPSSKIYYGAIKHFMINFVIWSGQKINRLFARVSNEKN